MAAVDYRIHSDGTFDILGRVALRRAYPALDDEPLRPTQIVTRDDRIDYTLTDGRRVVLRFERHAASVSVAMTLVGFERTPFYAQPVVARVEGATRLFRTGLGFSGPSGFVELSEQKAELESYLATALTTAGDRALVVAALDHRDYQQKATLLRRRHHRGLVNRHLEFDAATLEVALLTEQIPGGAELSLPAVHFFGGGRTFETLQTAARAIAVTMHARPQVQWRYHWCSWYERGPFYNSGELAEFLAGLESIQPPIPLQAVQIDDGYHTSHGDWLTPNERWPGGVEAMFGQIRTAGQVPGIWVGPFMVGRRSKLFAEHPDWIIRTHDGQPYKEWTAYDGTRNDEEHYALDASHPDARAYLGQVFRTMRQWGGRFFKTDFMDWGLKDSRHVRRHNPDETSVQSFRKALAVIREAIGDDSYWLACISPYAPFIGFADSIRIANDVGVAWSDGGTGNMIHEYAATQYFNNVLFHNDPDVIFLRDYHTTLTDAQVTALAYYQAMMGGSINTSDALHKLPAERLRLWRFLEPRGRPVSARLPFFADRSRTSRVLVRDGVDGDADAVLVFNPTPAPVTEVVELADVLPGPAGERFVYEWSHLGSQRLGRTPQIVARVGGRDAKLYYVSRNDRAPDTGLGLCGRG